MNVHRPLALWGAVVFSSAAVYLAFARAENAEKQDCGGDTYGTAIHWVRSGAEAKKLAREQEKLIFVLHLSGNFTRNEFT